MFTRLERSQKTPKSCSFAHLTSSMQTQTQPQALTDRIRDIGHPEAIRRFFGLLKELIDIVNLPNGDARLAFTVRKDRRSITANVNFFLALRILKPTRSEVEYWLTIKKSCREQLTDIREVDFVPLSDKSDYISVVIGQSSAHLLHHPVIRKCWEDCLPELVETAKRGPHVAHHNADIYKAAEDDAFLSELLRLADDPTLGNYQPNGHIAQEPEPAYAAQIATPNQPHNLILFGPPGTGKTFALQPYLSGNNATLITFHPSYSYEEFVEGIRPEVLGGQISYRVRKGVFYKACLSAIQLAGYATLADCLNDAPDVRARKLRHAPAYFLLIDEVNRASVSSVFGELITLLETDKRLGSDHELWATLPYSQERFGVPLNLYVMGTMNTTDRSIALLDLALRRRFAFREMQPDPSVLSLTDDGVDLPQLLHTVNERIEYLLDRDHQLGHAYLTGLQTHNELCGAFRDRIIPLLQEYFFNDWTKIGLVLGDNPAWGKTPEQRLIWTKKRYTNAITSNLFGELPDTVDEVVTYEINSRLTAGEFDQIPAEAFVRIYQRQ